VNIEGNVCEFVNLIEKTPVIIHRWAAVMSTANFRVS
jgi:hypothetical protein